MATKRLKIVVSKQQGVSTYSFRFKGSNVPMSGDEGFIDADEGDPRYLLWVMTGQPGGSMKVEVFNADGSLHTKREESTLSQQGSGFDRLLIKP